MGLKIIVNAEEKVVGGSEITYEEIVKLAGMTGAPSVTYHGRRYGDSQRSGMMHPGCAPVGLDHGMIFDVAHTGNT